jgi:hypothetical protein
MDLNGIFDYLAPFAVEPKDILAVRQLDAESGLSSAARRGN